MAERMQIPEKMKTGRPGKKKKAKEIRHDAFKGWSVKHRQRQDQGEGEGHKHSQ